MKTHPALPQVDMLLISQSSQKQRRMISGFVPKIGLSIVDYGRCAEIDTFYMLCQKHRDYYRDPTGNVRSVPYFDVRSDSCGKPKDKCTESFLCPYRPVRERLPILYPVAERVSALEPVALAGRYDRSPQVCFKR